jgi:putative phage-type endonuclease
MIEQRSDAWFKARLGKATGSRFNDVMSKIRSGESAARKNYRAELVAERLTGVPTPTFQSAPMAWGTDNEPLARLAYELETGNEVEDAPFVPHPELEAGASPDGFIGDDGLVEIKCPNTATHIETLKKGEVPRQYIAQVQGQLWITGRKWCDFVSFDPRLPENAQMVIVRVEADPIYQAELEDEIVDFLEGVDKECKFIKEYRG